MAKVSASSSKLLSDVSLDEARIVGANASDSAGAAPVPDDQLLDLFWNRAELKKRFSRLSDDLANRDDELRAKDAEIERAREQKRALERALGDTGTAFATIAYYHLRSLWQAANQHLVNFSNELVEQQSDRERKKQIMEFNQARESRLAALAEDIASAKQHADATRAVVKDCEQRFDALTGLFSYFARKRLAPELDANRQAYDAARAHIESLFDQRIKLESTPWPNKTELSVEGKRVINLAVIALAQHLYLHFSNNGLGALARTTTLKPLEDMEFGTREDCEFLIHRSSSAVSAMRADRSIADTLRERAKFLRRIAKFSQPTDTVPEAASVGQVQPMDGGVEFGNTVAGIPLDVNVLVEDYWSLGQVLLR